MGAFALRLVHHVVGAAERVLGVRQWEGQTAMPALVRTLIGWPATAPSASA